MYVRVDLRTGEKHLLEAEDFTRFHIEADGDRHDVLRVLGPEARLGPTHHLWWSLDAVRRLVPADAGEEWWQRFETMMGWRPRRAGSTRRAPMSRSTSSAPVAGS